MSGRPLDPAAPVKQWKYDRFWARVSQEPSGCWRWTGNYFGTGYGATHLLQERMAHRLAYRLLVGPIPSGLTLDHLCSHPWCVNPAHLEPVTQRENNLRSPISIPAINAAKTRCARGHEYSPENTLVRANGRGRTCRTCKAKWGRMTRLRKRGIAL